MLHYLLGILDLIYFYETNGIALTSFFLLLFLNFMNVCLTFIVTLRRKEKLLAVKSDQSFGMSIIRPVVNAKL